MSLDTLDAVNILRGLIPHVCPMLATHTGLETVINELNIKFATARTT